MVKIWSEWNVARLVLPVSAIVVLFWTAGLWTALLSFLSLTCASVGRVQSVYLAGLLTIDFDHKHSIGRILGPNLYHTQ